MNKSILSASLVLIVLLIFSFNVKANALFSHFGEIETSQSIDSPFVTHNSETGVQPNLAPLDLTLSLTGIGEVVIELDPKQTHLGRDYYKGVISQAGKILPMSDVVLVKTRTKGLMGLIELPLGSWLIMTDEKTGQQFVIKQDQVELGDEVLPKEKQTTIKSLSAMPALPVAEHTPDMDDDGNIVIDIFMGFAEETLPYVQDMDAWALMQVETINNGLKNSDIQGIRLRVVGTSTTPNSLGMDWHALREYDTWFAQAIEQYSPDLIAGYFLRHDGAERQALGWGYQGGEESMINILSPRTLRHEVGHNIGGSHCSDGSSASNW